MQTKWNGDPAATVPNCLNNLLDQELYVLIFLTKLVARKKSLIQKMDPVLIHKKSLATIYGIWKLVKSGIKKPSKVLDPAITSHWTLRLNLLLLPLVFKRGQAVLMLEVSHHHSLDQEPTILRRTSDQIWTEWRLAKNGRKRLTILFWLLLVSTMSTQAL